MRIEDEYGVTRAPDGLTFGAVLFLETIDGNNVPLPFLGQLANSGQIFCVPREAVGQVDEVFYSRSNLR